MPNWSETYPAADRQLRRRFWFEAVAATVSLIVGGLTLSRPNWIEIVFGVDPDRGSGLLEWLIVAVSVAVVLGASGLARREWRRRLTLDGPATPTSPASSGQL
jgi:hypothetical protein